MRRVEGDSHRDFCSGMRGPRLDTATGARLFEEVLS